MTPLERRQYEIDLAAARLCRARLATGDGPDALNHRGIGACGICIADTKDAMARVDDDRPSGITT